MTTSTKVQHTPTPWIGRPALPARFPAYRIADATGRTIAEVPIAAQGDAYEIREKILRAVNAHDELVEALKEIRDIAHDNAILPGSPCSQIKRLANTALSKSSAVNEGVSK